MQNAYGRGNLRKSAQAKAVRYPLEIAGERGNQTYFQRRDQRRNHRTRKRSGRGDFKIGRDSHLSFRARDRRSFHAHYAGDPRRRMAFLSARAYRTVSCAGLSASALRAQLFVAENGRGEPPQAFQAQRSRSLVEFLPRTGVSADSGEYVFNDAIKLQLRRMVAEKSGRAVYRF